MKDIAIYGAGGSGREVKLIIDAINKINPVYNVIGFFDDGKPKGEIINEIPVLGGLSDLEKINEPICIAISIANPTIKKKIVQSIKNKNVTYPNIIHPNVDLTGYDITLGQGNIISNGCIITCNIKIHDFVLMNLQSTVSHDSVINSYCSIMSAVSISGEVTLNEGIYIGVGARIINQIEVGAYTIIGSGAIVTQSLPANVTAVGIPAKPLKK